MKYSNDFRWIILPSEDDHTHERLKYCGRKSVEKGGKGSKSRREVRWSSTLSSTQLYSTLEYHRYMIIGTCLHAFLDLARYDLEIWATGKNEGVEVSQSQKGLSLSLLRQTQRNGLTGDSRSDHPSPLSEKGMAEKHAVAYLLSD